MLETSAIKTVYGSNSMVYMLMYKLQIQMVYASNSMVYILKNFNDQQKKKNSIERKNIYVYNNWCFLLLNTITCLICLMSIYILK